MNVSEPSTRFANLGCGRRFVSGWSNFDYVSVGSQVKQADLRNGIPLPTGSCQVVYHSHVLEHLPRAAGETFLDECIRIMAPNAILRIVVPDLQQIAKEYLDLCASLSEEPTAERFGEHQWMVAELIDQTARHSPGGEMLKLARNLAQNGGGIAQRRLGAEYDQMMQPAKPAMRSLSNNARTMVKNILSVAYRMAGIDAEALQIGRFRLRGEVHQWMYDFASLKFILQKRGLVGIVRRAANESYCLGWEKTRLDIDPSGRPHKPDSLYLECQKAGA